MSVPLLSDQAARDRIRTELDTNLCVEAAAGTGKTTVLVDRVVNLLATGVVMVDELVVITFTEKAAAELATRVRDALERRARAATDEAERGRVLTAARDLYRAHIETIHSFATALLRERPVEAGLDPLFDVLEGIAATLDFDKAYERFQDQLLSEPLPEVEQALRRGLGLGELREACEKLNGHRYLLPLIHPRREADDVEGTIATLRRVAAGLREMLVRHQPGEDKAVPIVERIIAWIGRLDELDPLEQERWLLFHTAPRTNKQLGSNANWGGEKPKLCDLQQDYSDALAEASARLRRNALLGLLPHVERFVREYEIERRKAGRADFDDLLFWARDLLRDSAPAREYFRRRFRAVLIDEFQDTDPVQAELALLLTSDDDPGDDWRTLRPGTGRLTVVGDPKQSIYRFRRADIAVYDDVRTGALDDGSERISTNFRSNPELLRALNATFDRVLTAEAHIQPGNVPLDAPSDAPRSRRAPVILAEGHVVASAEGVRSEEARVIAGMLHEARREEWEIRDRHDGDRWRPCRWGDMAILLPARTGLELYEEALVRAGIPYRHEGARDFFQREEVRDLVWVLSAIDDPTDRLALVGALRSSAFAISDEELVVHAASVRALSYRSPEKGPSELVNRALAELHELHRMRRGLSLPELVRRVVDRTQLVEFALTRPDGEQGAANLLAIVDDARLFASAGGGGLRPFIRHLRDSMENEAPEIDATVAEETDDVVRIMTTHGAKGLEYPIVALANLGTQPHIPAEPVPRERDAFLYFRVGAGTLGRTGHFATPDYDDVWEAEKAYIMAERLRLLYVAATRARDHLLIPCVVGRHEAKHLLGELVHALPDDPELVEVLDAELLTAPAVDVADPTPISEDEIDAAVSERAAWIDAREHLKSAARVERDIETASSRERSIGPLAAEVATFGATLLVGDGPPLPVGDAVHMVMERVTLPGAQDLEQIAEDVCLEGDIAGQLEDVITMCRACLQAPSLERAVAGGRWWREVPFVLRRDRAARDPSRGPLATGRVDMVHDDGGELVVIDYKTDKDVTPDTAEKHALDKHGGQAEIYSQALAAATGLPVREVAFVYCKAGVEVRLREGGASQVIALENRMKPKGVV